MGDEREPTRWVDDTDKVHMEGGKPLPETDIHMPGPDPKSGREAGTEPVIRRPQAAREL